VLNQNKFQLSKEQKTAYHLTGKLLLPTNTKQSQETLKKQGGMISKRASTPSTIPLIEDNPFLTLNCPRAIAISSVVELPSSYGVATDSLLEPSGFNWESAALSLYWHLDSPRFQRLNDLII
jgi:hypothetical protein